MGVVNDGHEDGFGDTPLFNLDVALVNATIGMFSCGRERTMQEDHITLSRARQVMNGITLSLHGDLGCEQTFACEKSFMVFILPPIRTQVIGVPEVTLRKLLTREELVSLLAGDVAFVWA